MFTKMCIENTAHFDYIYRLYIRNNELNLHKICVKIMLRFQPHSGLYSGLFTIRDGC